MEINIVDIPIQWSLGIKKEGIPAGLALLGDNKHFFIQGFHYLHQKAKKKKNTNREILNKKVI